MPGIGFHDPSGGQFMGSIALPFCRGYVLGTILLAGVEFCSQS